MRIGRFGSSLFWGLGDMRKVERDQIQNGEWGKYLNSGGVGINNFDQTLTVVFDSLYMLSTEMQCLGYITLASGIATPPRKPTPQLRLRNRVGNLLSQGLWDPDGTQCSAQNRSAVI